MQECKALGSGRVIMIGRGKKLEKARELARRIAGNAPLSNYAITSGLPRMQDLSHDDGLFFESLLAAYTSADTQAADRLRDFVEKRAAPLGSAHS